MLNVGKFMKSNTNYLLNSIAYLVTFGFLFPIGFSQYFNFYKRIQNIYILCVALLIAIFIIYRILSSKSIEFSPALVSLITCYIILLIINFLISILSPYPCLLLSLPSSSVLPQTPVS